MKSCPRCNRTYADDTMTFCLDDGSVLSAAYDLQATMNSPDTRQTNPQSEQTRYLGSQDFNPPTMQSPGANMPYQPNYSQQSWQNAQPAPPRRRTGLWLLAIAAVLLMMFGAGLAMFLTQTKLFGGSDSSTGVREKDPAVSNDNKTISNDNKTTANKPATTTNAPLPASSPTPANSPEATPVPVLNIVGTWSGTYTTDSATLSISSQSGNTFSGTLNSGGFLIAISGRVDPTTREVTWTETSVIKRTAAKYTNWILGVNRGTISSDGKKISGRGKAKGQAAYSWAFSK